MSKLSDKIGGFVVIPNTIIKLIPQMGPEAFTLWSYLRFRANGETGIAFPSYETIHNDTGLHYRKIAKALRTLESLNLLDRTKRFGDSTEYTLLCPEPQASPAQSCQRVQTNKSTSTIASSLYQDSLSTKLVPGETAKNAASLAGEISILEPVVGGELPDDDDPFAGAYDAPPKPKEIPKLDPSTRRLVIEAMTRLEGRGGRMDAESRRAFYKDWQDEVAPMIQGFFGYSQVTNECYTVARSLLTKKRPKLGDKHASYMEILNALDVLADSREARLWRNNPRVNPYMVPMWVERQLAQVGQTLTNGSFVISAMDKPTVIEARLSDDEIGQLIWTPTEAQTNYVEWGKRSIERKNVLVSGIESFDSQILPLFPGQARIICARPGGGKSTFALATGVIPAARKYVKEQSNKACLIVSYDQTIEELEGIIASQSGHTLTDVAWGRVPIHLIEQSVHGRELLPIYYLGKSGIQRRRSKARMTVDNVHRAIELIEARHGIEIQLIMVDFMQIIPIKGRSGRAEQVSEAYALYHELIQDLQAFGLFLSQANRSIESEKIKIPKLIHSEWTDLAGQYGHQFVGIWRPWTTEQPIVKCPLYEKHPEYLERNERCWFCGGKGLVPQIEAYIGGSVQKMNVASSLMVSQFSKHRFEEPNKTFYHIFDTRLVRLAEIEWLRYQKGQIPEFS